MTEREVLIFLLVLVSAFALIEHILLLGWEGRL